MNASYFIIAALVWLLLASIRSYKPQQVHMSQFELKRRVALYSSKAVKELEKMKLLPNLYALSYAVETLCFIIMLSLLIGGYGVINGIAITTAALLLLPLVSRLSVVSSITQKMYEKHETALFHVAKTYQPLLKWLRAREIVSKVYINSKEEFLHLAESSKDMFNKDELLLLRHGLEFNKKIVQDIMTPQSVIQYTDENETVGPIVLDRLHKTGHSRFPVVKGDINHIVGILYMHDLVPLDKTLKTVKKAMHEEVYYIRNDRSLEHALHAFLRTHHHLFIVVNEYRETVGLLSLEDTIEALLGRKIIDEFDAFHDLRSVATTNPHKNNQPIKHEDI